MAVLSHSKRVDHRKVKVHNNIINDPLSECVRTLLRHPAVREVLEKIAISNGGKQLLIKGSTPQTSPHIRTPSSRKHPARVIMSLAQYQNRDDILLLFDVDGTLTMPRSNITADFERFLYERVKPRATIGIVGGSDLEKMFEQLNGRQILQHFDYVFPENGLVQIERGVEVGKQSIHLHLGERTLQRFINYVLRYLSELEVPVKRGTFVEFRNGMLNVCPIGRQCTRAEREEFNRYDAEHGVRESMIKALRAEFADVDLTYSIGGQISFDVFPRGWDKTYALRHFEKQGRRFREIHFFGDKVEKGGNDHEIYTDERVVGHRVYTPVDTQRILTDLLALEG